jgi:transposase-like protein
VIDSKSASSAPVGDRFPREVMALAVRWYLRYGLSYRDVEQLLAERGINVDHVTVYRWVQRFTLEFIDAAGPARHVTGDQCFVDETYVKVAGRWTTSTERLISTAKSSMSSSPAAVMAFQHGHSSPARLGEVLFRLRSPPTGHPYTHG